MFMMFMSLCKVPISLTATLSAALGFILAHDGVSPDILLVVLGTFLLACGASALNHVQEEKLDAMMKRTMGRPIPTHRIGRRAAILVTLLLVAAGTVVLARLPSLYPMILGAVAIVWYNGIYTYLKRVTVFAAVPGAVVGAVPPMIGWTAAGGDILSAQIITLALFFAVWQIPHFWLLLLKYGKEYRSAGLPSLTSVLTDRQLSRVTFVWIVATSVMCLLLPLYGIVRYSSINVLLVVAAIGLVMSGAKIVTQRDTAFSMAAFKAINIFILVVISLLSIDRLI